MPSWTLTPALLGMGQAGESCQSGPLSSSGRKVDIHSCTHTPRLKSLKDHVQEMKKGFKSSHQQYGTFIRSKRYSHTFTCVDTQRFTYQPGLLSFPLAIILPVRLKLIVDPICRSHTPIPRDQTAGLLHPRLEDAPVVGMVIPRRPSSDTTSPVSCVSTLIR